MGALINGTVDPADLFQSNIFSTLSVVPQRRKKETLQAFFFFSFFFKSQEVCFPIFLGFYVHFPMLCSSIAHDGKSRHMPGRFSCLSFPSDLAQSVFLKQIPNTNSSSLGGRFFFIYIFTTQYEKKKKKNSVLPKGRIQTNKTISDIFSLRTAFACNAFFRHRFYLP